MPDALHLTSLLWRLLNAAAHDVDSCFATTRYSIDVGTGGKEGIEAFQSAMPVPVGGRAASGTGAAGGAAGAAALANTSCPSHRRRLRPPGIEVTAPSREDVDHLRARCHPQSRVQRQGGVGPSRQEALHDLTITCRHRGQEGAVAVSLGMGCVENAWRGLQAREVLGKVSHIWLPGVPQGPCPPTLHDAPKARPSCDAWVMAHYRWHHGDPLGQTGRRGR
mmetsp:Transcript_62504/g.134316  ORF Transcript_62504/g.134316 Transcript_62504/m.134316 type:complete len:221 (-) Transcript_62504:105-767(-)